MGSPETVPKDFISSAEILPLKTPGLLELAKFRENERKREDLEEMKRWGLTDDEIQLYRDNEEGLGKCKMEDTVLRTKLEYIYSKLRAARQCEVNSEENETDESKPGTSGSASSSISDYNLKTYPPGHPMNDIKQLEKDLFDHVKTDDITPINKRRKILRRLQRKQDSMELNNFNLGFKDVGVNTNIRDSSLWDVREMPQKSEAPNASKSNSLLSDASDKLIGPKPRTNYTIRDNKIVRLEPLSIDGQDQNYRAVDIVVPVNEGEERLLEGTKLSIDNIRSMERFKHYEPGKPSKVLFLKNISPQASSEDISILFNQFVHENGAPVDVRLMTGRLRGQAFVHFRLENVAIQALEDVNGTVVKGRPVIAQFGKNSNNIQDVNR